MYKIFSYLCSALEKSGKFSNEEKIYKVRKYEIDQGRI